MSARPSRSASRGDPGTVAVSVVVCTSSLDRWDDLGAAIESIRAQTVPPLEIILVVDHNPELEERSRASWPDLNVVTNPGSRGISNARNAGIAQSSGSVVAFLDDDARADPEWLAGMLRGYRNESVIGVGGRIEPAWQEKRPAWFPDEFGWVVGCSYIGLPETMAAVRNVIGANMSFRREILEALGGFDSRLGRVAGLPIGCDETELCIRALRRFPGKRIVYNPEARVAHRVSADRGHWGYFISRCYGEGRSKATVSKLVGSRDALSTERRYATSVLPAGVARGIRGALLEGDRAGLGRAGAILAGFAATVIGFVAGPLPVGEQASSPAGEAARPCAS